MFTKRPKSTISSASLDRKHRKSSVREAEDQNLPYISDKIKKWQQISKEVHRQLQLSACISRSSNFHKSLHKMGGKSYQLRQPTQQAQDPSKKATPTVLLKKNNNTNHQYNSKVLQNFRIGQKPKPNIKRCSRQYMESKANLQYDKMVLKIGSHMQYEQKFTMYYIENIKNVQIIDPTPMPIVYGIKSQTETYNACMTSFKNQQMPICISLFTESFHAKLEDSIDKKRQYFEKMKKQMNGTFDPEIMSRMPIINKKKQFNDRQYFSNIQKFYTKLSPQQKHAQMISIERALKQNLKPFLNYDSKLSKLSGQVYQDYQRAIAIVNFDYFLKDPNNLNRMNQMRQFLTSSIENIASFRVRYHGGYSKSLYRDWCKYYNIGRVELPKKIVKLCSKVQLVNDWLQEFQSLNFVQNNLFEVLLGPLSPRQMKTLHLIKIQESYGVFKNICIKGIMTILAFNRKLQRTQRQHNRLIEPITKYEYLKPEQNNVKSSLNLNLDNQNQIIDWFQKILQSRHQVRQIYNISQLQQIASINEILSEADQKRVNKSVSILVNIFYQKIISKSLSNFIQIFQNSNKPLLKLNLVVDRQSLKIQESEDFIIQIFDKVISEIVSKSINCTTSGFQISCVNNYKQYGSLNLPAKGQQTQRANNDWQLTVEYRNFQIQQRRIIELTQRIRDWYHQSQMIIQNFGCFMPFIKLTAKQKIFMQEQDSSGMNQWQQAKLIFSSNREKVQFYRQKLAETPKKFIIGIFEIDCSQPHKILRDRISEIQYLFQQKYLSKVFQKIHEMQQDLGKIMTMLHSVNIKINNIEDIADMLDKSKKQLIQIKKKAKDLSHHIYFYIDKAKSNIVITRFTQLLHKRSQLLAQIDQLKVKVKQDSYYLEIKRQEQRQIFVKNIKKVSQKLKQYCQQCLDLNKLDRHLEVVKSMSDELYQFHKQFNQIKDPNYSYEQEQLYFEDQINRISTIYDFWSNVNQFNCIIKQLALQKIRQIDITPYQRTVQTCSRVTAQFQAIKVQLNQINNAHFLKFKQQIKKHMQLLFYLKILADKSINLEYFVVIQCQSLLNMPFRNLIGLKNWQIYMPRLKEMEVKAKAEQQIFMKYSQIEKRFQSLKLTIIDVHGCDTLDSDVTKQMASLLHESCFQCQRLLLFSYAKKYYSKIEKLRQKMMKCEYLVIKWLQVEGKFVVLEAFYKNNDDAYLKQTFKRLSQSHRKVIKSFDMDNSVKLIPNNLFLITSLESSNQALENLKKDLYCKFNQLQSSVCRLQLLCHQQLLQIMSFVNIVPKYLPKCFPSIQNFGLNELSLDRVGGYVVKNSGINMNESETVMGNFIELREPIHLGSRLAGIQTWIEKLITDIKQSLKKAFTQSDKKQGCLQIMQLKQQLQFTEEIEQILESQQQNKLLQSYIRNLETKINMRAKSVVQKYNTQMILLLLIMERDFVSLLLSESDEISLFGKQCFEWLKFARFYNITQQQGKKVPKIQIKMQVLTDSYLYNFMFIEKCDFIVQDILFIGNSILGKKGTGKKSIVKHYAYLTGNQLFIFQRDRISTNVTENIVNFYKLAITTGGWLLIPQVNLMNPEEMRTIAECLSYLNNALAAKLPKMEIFVYKQFNLNENCRVFFTLDTLNNVPTRLAHNFRPIWICAPSIDFISEVCNEVAIIFDNKLSKKQVQVEEEDDINSFAFKIIDFVYQNRYHQNVPLYLAQSMLQRAERPTCVAQNLIPNCTILNSLLNNKFILHEDLGLSSLQQQNILTFLQNTFSAVIYLPNKEHFKFVNNNFFEDQIVYLAMKQNDYKTIKRNFNFIKSKIKKTQIKYLIFFESLRFFKDIQRQITDQIIEKANIKVIYLQNIKNLKSQANLRIIANFPTTIIKSLQSEPQIIKRQLIRKKSTKNSSFQTYNTDLQQNYQRIVDALVFKHLRNRLTIEEIEQIQRLFQKLYSRLIYSKNIKEVSFVFSLAWIFGNYVTQKDIIEELNLPQYDFLFQKTLKYCSNLRQLYPKKNGFVSISSFLEETHDFCFGGYNLSVKSILLSNIKLLCELLNDQIILIKSSKSLDQIINSLFSNCYHLYPTHLTSLIAFKDILQHQLKIKIGQNLHFVLHAVDRIDISILDFITSYYDKNQVLYIQRGDLKIFKQRKFQVTMSACSVSKLPKYSIFNLTIFEDQMVSIQINQLESIKFMMRNCSSLSQSIYKGLISFYRNNFSKFYWLEQPIRPSFTRYCKSNNTQDFFLWLLRYILLALPNEKTKLINQICYCNAPTSFLKVQEIEYQIKINNAVDTINVLEQTLSNIEIQIRRNICKDMIVMNQNFNAIPYSYDMLYKTYLAISQCHTILLGSIFTQRFYCLQTISKVLNLSIISFSYDVLKQNKKQADVKKNILLITEKDINQKLLQILQSQICQENSVINRNYIVVLKLTTDNNESQNIYKSYPFLKKYFIQVLFIKKSQQDITKNINLVKTLKHLQNGQNKYELSVLNDWQIPPELQVQKSISQYFETQLFKNFGFLMRLLQLRRQFEQQQFNKYKFYRALTEQLFHTISMFGQQLKEIPNKIQIIVSKQNYIQNCKEKIQEVFNQLQKSSNELKKQIQALENIVSEKNLLVQKSRQKISTDQKQFETNFKKIYTKMDSLGVQQHSKFKPNPQNQTINQIYNLISNLIKWQPGKLKKIPTLKLDLISKQKHSKWDKHRQHIRKILTMYKGLNLKKASDKLSPVFLALVEWIEQIQYFKFKNIEENQKAHQLVERVEKEIGEIKGEIEGLREKLGKKEEEIDGHRGTIEECNKEWNQLQEQKKVSNLRKQRIEVVLHQMADKEQKIKISKDLAERLYFLPKIIMSKSINQMALNEYDDDSFIVRQLFLKSNRQEQLHYIHDQDLFMYDLPLFQNIFDDFQAVVTIYKKYNLFDLDFDQIKLIQTIVSSKERVQIIEDTYDLISSKMFDVFGNFLSYKVLDLTNARFSVIIKDILLKCNNYNRIIIQLSRFQKEQQVKKLIQVLVTAISEKQSLKIVVVLKKFQALYQTDRFRWVSNKRVCLTYRKYLRQFAKIANERVLTNQWEYYQTQNQFNKSHKTLFEVFEKFQPQNAQSFNNMLQAIQNFGQIRTKRTEASQAFQQYFQNLCTISSGFGSYYILLKYLEMIDRNNPIQMFQQGGLFKNYQLALKKSVAQLYGVQIRNNQDLFKSFVLHMSYLINFVDQQQVIQYCMMVSFLFTKPSNITPYLVVGVLKNAQRYKNQNQRIQYIIKAIQGKVVSLTLIDKKLSSSSLDFACQTWLSYLIFSSARNCQNYCQVFMNKLRNQKLQQMNAKMIDRTTISDVHYFVSKSKLDFKNEFKLTSCRQRACKYFWVIKVKKQHVQRFMQVLQTRVHALRQQIKLVNFFFNENKYQGNLEKLLELSQKKMFVCIYNLGRQKSYIIEDIISHIEQRSKNIHQMFKIFFLTQDCIFLKNRQHIDFIIYTPSQQDQQSSFLKSTQIQISQAVKSLPNPQSHSLNIQIINSLPSIIQKCLQKMQIVKHKDRVNKLLIQKLLNEKILMNQGHAIKFVCQYFKIGKVSHEQVLQYCKIKEHLFGLVQGGMADRFGGELGASYDHVSKWSALLQKLQQSNTIQQKYKTILKSTLTQSLSWHLKPQPTPTPSLISQPQLKNIIKYGWLKIQSADTLKFLLYKGLRQGLKQSSYQYNCNLICQLKIVCEVNGKIVGLRLAELNGLFCNGNIVEEIEMKVLALPDGNEEVLVDGAEIESILQQFNIRLSLAGDKDTLGKLYLAYK